MIFTDFVCIVLASWLIQAVSPQRKGVVNL